MKKLLLFFLMILFTSGMETNIAMSACSTEEIVSEEGSGPESYPPTFITVSEDDGIVDVSVFAGAVVKPPKAALVKSRGSERLGKVTA